MDACIEVKAYLQLLEAHVESGVFAETASFDGAPRLSTWRKTNRSSHRRGGDRAESA